MNTVIYAANYLTILWTIDKIIYNIVDNLRYANYLNMFIYIL